MKKLVDVDIILRVTVPGGKLPTWVCDGLALCNDDFPRMGVYVYFDPTLDGMLAFYATFEDFCSSFFLPGQCPALPTGLGGDLQPSGGDPLQWEVCAEKLPSEHAFEELARIAGKRFETLVPGSRLEMTGPRTARLTIPDLKFFQQILSSLHASLTAITRTFTTGAAFKSPRAGSPKIPPDSMAPTRWIQKGGENE